MVIPTYTKMINPKYKADIHKFLESFIGSIDFEEFSFAKKVLNRILDYSIGGKCIRGSLVIETYNLYGGEDFEKALRVGASVELFHSSILMMDDIMDCRDIRRGKPSIHKQFENFNVNRISKKDGECYAMCVSTITNYIGFKLLKGVDSKIMGLILNNYSLTYLTQMRELQTSGDITVPREDIEKIYRIKTGRYTFSCPTMIGILLSGNKSDDMIFDLGEELGLLFHIKDDFLEIEGSTHEIGKSITSDIVANIMTLPRFLLRNKIGNPDELERLDSIFGKDVSADDLEFLRSMYKKHNVIPELYSYMNEIEASIKSKLGKHKLRKTIVNFMDYNRKRKK